jgi:flagellar motor switch protein FliN/FliY
VTLPDEFADVLAGTVAVADPAVVIAPEPVATAAPAEVAPAPLEDDDEDELVEELELVAGADGHLDLRLLSDVQVELSVELGRITLPLRALLGLAPGSVLQLDRPADAPVDVLVNDSPVSRGEVVVIGGDFGVRVTSLVER